MQINRFVIIPPNGLYLARADCRGEQDDCAPQNTPGNLRCCAARSTRAITRRYIIRSVVAVILREVSRNYTRLFFSSYWFFLFSSISFSPFPFLFLALSVQAIVPLSALSPDFFFVFSRPEARRFVASGGTLDRSRLSRVNATLLTRETLYGRVSLRLTFAHLSAGSRPGLICQLSRISGRRECKNAAHLRSRNVNPRIVRSTSRTPETTDGCLPISDRR